MFFSKHLFFALVFCLIFSVSAKADRWDEQTTYQHIIEKAQAGSAYFQGLLGIYLRSGEAGSSVNVELSTKWSKVAAKHDHPFGAYNLANLAMLEGDLVSATTLYQDAAFRLQRYASDGDPVAMYCMGEIDFQVIPTNVPRAINLFIRSAELGYPQAQATIGALYLRGLPGLLERNTDEGIKLLSKAIRAKSLTARFNLGMAYYNGDGVEKNILKASQWLRLAVKQNFSEAQYSLGLLLIDGGEGIKKNTIEGLKHIKDAAAQDHQLAREYLRKRTGTFKTTDDTAEEAPNVNFAQPSLIPNDKERMERARQYYTGVGAERNYNSAYELFFPLAQGGNAEAARFVGLMKLSGKGTVRDLTLAKEWLSVASQKGDRVATKLLNSYKSLF